MKKEQYRTELSDLDFDELDGIITSEELLKLKENKPRTLFAASRISGIRPTTLILMHQTLKNKKNQTTKEKRNEYRKVEGL